MRMCLGSIICQNSSTDRWLYVMKTGSCKVLKKLYLNRNAYEHYKNALRHRSNMKDEKAQHDISDSFLVDSLPPMKSSIDEMASNSIKLLDDYFGGDRGEGFSYLEMNKLCEGDVFGIKELVFTEEHEKNTLLLVSEGK
jgi:hypothetical protein